MVRGIGGLHRGLVLSALAMAGAVVVEPRRTSGVSDRDLEPIDRESLPPQPPQPKDASRRQFVEADERALSLAEQKRARKNARRLFVTGAA